MDRSAVSNAAVNPQRRVIVIVPAEADQSNRNAEFLRTVTTLGRNWDTPVHVIAAGTGAQEAARLALRFGAAGAWTITNFDRITLPQTHQLVAAFHQALINVEIGGMDGPDLILFPAGRGGEECAARVAGRLAAIALGRCLTLEPIATGFRATRSGFGGRVLAHIEVRGRPCVAVVRSSVSAAIDIGHDNGGAEVRTFNPQQPLPAAHRVHTTPALTVRPNLEGANVIVSGGRGIGCAEGFQDLERLAHCLGGVVGGSLPAADAGWIPVSQQVGQSGKYVTPNLYIAVGVSGTAQHLAGIDPRARIMVINRDPQAEIFRVAEIGAVGDWREIVPELIEQLRKPA